MSYQSSLLAGISQLMCLSVVSMADLPVTPWIKTLIRAVTGTISPLDDLRNPVSKVKVEFLGLPF